QGAQYGFKGGAGGRSPEKLGTEEIGQPGVDEPANEGGEQSGNDAAESLVGPTDCTGNCDHTNHDGRLLGCGWIVFDLLIGGDIEFQYPDAPVDDEISGLLLHCTLSRSLCEVRPFHPITSLAVPLIRPVLPTSVRPFCHEWHGSRLRIL